MREHSTRGYLCDRKKFALWIAARGTVLFGSVAILSMSALALYASGSFTDANNLTATIFDIGQGDAIHLRLPHGQDILVDGGPSNRVVEKLGSSMPFFDRHIDVAVATHPDADHITGLIGVMSTYRVGTLLILDIERNTPEYDELIAVARRYRIPVQKARPGQIFQFASGARFEILASGDSKSVEAGEALNDSSIVAIMRYQDVAMLLTGDAGVAVEREILAKYPSLQADILKAGHHGSRTSTSKALLDAISPRAVLISAGADNTYGHPHREVVERINESGASLYRTDRQGDIIVTSDGETFEIKTARQISAFE